MARKNGKQAFDLKKELLAEGPRFSFFQALRLLSLLKPVAVRPDLSMAFPASDITAISERQDGRGFNITATFLGLYGASSPLPNFYTEDLLADARDDSEAARDFIDILHRRYYELLFDCWKKNRLFLSVSEQKDSTHHRMLLALFGNLPAEKGQNTDDFYSLLRYTGLFGSHPRSALGLQTILSDFLRGVPVEIIPCIPRSVKIPSDQRFRLGSAEYALGENMVLGERLVDHQSKFRVQIGPLNQEQFCSILPGGDTHKAMTKLIDKYLLDPLQYDFKLIVSEGEAQPICLGAPQWSRLGLDTVLFTGKLEENLTVYFSSTN